MKAPSKDLRRRLIAASFALIGANAVRSQEAPDAGPNEVPAQGDWSVDSALAYYREQGRIQAIEPVVSLRDDFGDGESVSLNVTYDSLSGSSPNGALPSRAPQTFASPSGKSLNAVPQTYTSASGTVSEVSAPIYTVAPGQLPADPNYHDQRFAFGGTWTLPWTRLRTVTLGSKFSFEHDFLSGSVNALIAQDLNEKNTTLSLGLNGEFDSVRPIGGSPVPASDYALFEKTGDKSKDGGGVILGVTQVMNRRWLSELNLSVDRFSGYLNDPYKIISVINAAGNTTGYLYEKRPGERLREGAYLENRVGLDWATLALSLRYMTDDWGVRSDTAQFRVRFFSPSRNQYVEPQIRWYRQTAADFYTPWISGASGQVSDASSDSRLGALHAWTYGLKYAARVDTEASGATSEFSVRLEYYSQTADDQRIGPGALQGINLYPGLNAVLLQIGWNF